MSGFIAGVFTFFLVINCLVLILLVLVQLPKKDAGAGLAFGSGTADALFGAGSGNTLTWITKWATVGFLLLALMLGYMQNSAHSQGDSSDFARKVQESASKTSVPPPAPAAIAPATAPAVTPAASPSATIPAAISGAAAVSTNAAK